MDNETRQAVPNAKSSCPLLLKSVSLTSHEDFKPNNTHTGVFHLFFTFIFMEWACADQTDSPMTLHFVSMQFLK